jgi:hypothetical protein
VSGISTACHRGCGAGRSGRLRRGEDCYTPACDSGEDGREEVIYSILEEGSSDYAKLSISKELARSNYVAAVEEIPEAEPSIKIEKYEEVMRPEVVQLVSAIGLPYELTNAQKIGIQSNGIMDDMFYNPEKHDPTENIEHMAGEVKDDMHRYAAEAVVRYFYNLAFDIVEAEGDQEGWRALRRAMVTYFLAMVTTSQIRFVDNI